ncbi:MAG: hypothetical protein PVG61_02980 [Dehalococcoidia bacterium]|jgi:hypothetical protein
MTENMTTIVVETSKIVSCIDWIQIIITVGVLFAAVWAGITAKRSFHLNTFSSLLKELSSEEASIDRGLVKDIQSNDPSHIKELVDLVRKDETSRRADLGRAAERTIARIDRVGFFLLGNGDILRAETPIWLWTLVEQIWKKLGIWVTYRQTCKEKDPDFYHQNYGFYFQKLENYRIMHKL